MGTKAGLVLLGVYHLANGLVMLLWPVAWAGAVVHLAAPDPLHRHFIADIAMAFLASGTGLVLGARDGRRWAAAGATWPALHALVHLEEWIADGPPPVAGDLVKEGIGVIAAGAAGVALAWMRARQGEG